MDININKIKQKIVKNYFSLIKDSHFKEIKSIEVEDNNKVAICFVANKRYIEGLATVVHSLKKNNKNVPTIILFSEDIEEAPDDVDKLIKIDVEDYRYLEMFNELNKPLLWPKSIYYKLSIFNVYGYDRIVFIDSDMLVIKDISDLWDLDEYNEFDFYATLTYPKVDDKSNQQEDKLCSALMVINKNLLGVHVYKKLIEMAVLHKTYEGSDQGVINYYLRKKSVPCGLINQYYNTFPCDKHISRCKGYDRPATILHFIGGWLKFTSWHDRIHCRKHFDQKYIDLYDEYYKG